MDDTLQRLARRRLKQAEDGVVAAHGVLELRLGQRVGGAKVGETLTLEVSVFDLEVAGRSVHHVRALVDVAPTVRLVNPRGIESGLAVVRDGVGRYHAEYLVEAPGMHSWTAAAEHTSRTLGFWSRR